MRNNTKNRVQRMTLLAAFSAVAYAVVFVLRISGIGGFLTFDIKDTIIAVAAMLLGPVSGVVISLTVALLEMITVSGTGPWGALMNFVSSSVFSASAALVYNYAPKVKKKLTGAWCGLGASIFATPMVMMLMNLLITPIYQGIPVKDVAAMIIPLLLPFNLIKSVLNSALVMMVYKPVSITLKKSGFLFLMEEKSETEKLRFSKASLVIFIISAIISAVSVYLLISVFGGEFNIIKK